MATHKKIILFIEDETSLRESIALNLEIEGYQVMALDRGTNLPQLLTRNHFDLILLDIMLPELDGIDLCKIARNNGYKMPILLLSAKTDSADRVLGLKAGADDYMVKPFELDELLFRVNKLLTQDEKAPPVEAPEKYVFAGTNVFYPNTLYAKNYKMEPVVLSKKESRLLRLLLDNKNIVLSREKILHYIWGYTVFPTTRTIDNFILKFRKFFEVDPSNPRYFISKRSVGYVYLEEAPQETHPEKES